MKIIIDTHIFLWALTAPERIALQKRKALETPVNIIYVSTITITEIMIKASIGKLNIIFDSKDLALQSGFELLDFTSQAALLLTATPDQLPLSCGQYIEFAMRIRSPKLIRDIIPTPLFQY